MSLPSFRRRPSASCRLSGFLPATGTALLLSCALLSGCGDAAAKAESDMNRELTEALTAYGSIASAHLAVTEKGGIPVDAYTSPTVQGASAATPKPTWPDLSQLASRLDQYAALAKRFKAITDSPTATAGQKALAGATLSEIQRHRSRYLLRRADLNRAALTRMLSGLEGALGEIQGLALGQPAPRGHGVVSLVEQGGVDGKIASLADLTKAHEAAAAEVVKLEADAKTADEAKAALRAKADELYAKESELKIALRRAYGKERFDLTDQASLVRRDAEIAEAAIAGKALEHDILSRRLDLAAKGKIALEGAIAHYVEQRDNAKKDLAAAGVGSDEAAKKSAEIHAKWMAEAKVFDAQFTEKVDGPLAAAAAAVKEAQATLAKAAADAGADAADLLPTLAIDQAGMAVELAQVHAVRLRALETHKSGLRELAAREKAWLTEPDASFIADRVAAMTQTQAQSAKAAADACTEAETAVTAALGGGRISEETKGALEGVQKNAAEHKKTVGTLTKGLPAVVEAAPEAPKPEAKPEVAPEAKPEEPKAEEPKAPEAPKEEPKPADAPAAEEKPAETPAN